MMKVKEFSWTSSSEELIGEVVRAILELPDVELSGVVMIKTAQGMAFS